MTHFVPKHVHLIVRAEVINPPMSTLEGKELLLEMIREAGMTCISGPHCKYVSSPGNEGLTGVAILAESHCAIHVWDQVFPALVQFDLYSCKEFDVNNIVAVLDKYNVSKLEYKLLDRENDLTIIHEA